MRQQKDGKLPIRVWASACLLRLDESPFVHISVITHQAPVLSLAFPPDDRFLAAASGTDIHRWQLSPSSQAHHTK